MKILYLNPFGAIGGAERSLLDFVAALREEPLDLDLHLIAGTDGPLLREAERLGVRTEVVRIPSRLSALGDSLLRLSGRSRWRSDTSLAWRLALGGLQLPGYALRLRARISALAPDIVHSNGLKTHALAGALALPAPVLWHVHDFAGSRPLASRALRLTARGATAAIANSHAVARDFESVAPTLPIETIYYGIDTNTFAPGDGDGERLDELAKLPRCGDPAVLRVGLVATYARWKGQTVLLEAAARLARRQPGVQVRYYIIGGPIYETHGSQFTEAELRQEAARLGVAPVVGFIPFQKDVANLYRSLDIVVHASTEPEPFGRTIVEAMACGRAVIVSRAGGAAELFGPEIDALGVRPGDPEALAAAIQALALDPRRRAALGANARRTTVERFSRPRLGPELRAVYERLVRGSRPAREAA